MAGLLGKIKSKSGYPETQNFFPSESRGRYPTMKAWNGRWLPFRPAAEQWTKGSTTLPERNPTTVG